MQFTARADTVPAGTQIQVRPDSEIKVSKWDRGRIYTGHVERDVRAADGDVTIPRGSNVELIVRQVGPERMAIRVSGSFPREVAHGHRSGICHRQWTPLRP